MIPLYPENISTNKYFSKLFVSILIFLCFTIGKTAHSQNCLDDIHKNALFSNSNNIINGTKWVNEKKYLGSPMLIENYWPKANILYKELQYSGQFMNYDVYNNQAIIFHPENGNEKYVNLEMEHFSGFTFIDTLTGRTHQYKYLELPGIKGKALYEIASTEKIPLYIRPVKTIETMSSGKFTSQYVSRYDIYIGNGNENLIIRSKIQLIKFMGDHVAEIKRYIRKNNLKINNRHPEDIVAVLKYFDTLN